MGNVASASVLALWITFLSSASFWYSPNFCIDNQECRAAVSALPTAAPVLVGEQCGAVWLGQGCGAEL